MEEITKSNRKKKRSVFKAFILTIISTVAIIVIVGGILFGIYISKAKQELPDIEMYSLSPEQASQIFDYKGTTYNKRLCNRK